MNDALPKRMLLVGCGNMGGAMLEGWLRAGLSPAIFTVADPYIDNVPEGVTHLVDLPKAGELNDDPARAGQAAVLEPAAGKPATFDAVLLGFKPQGLMASAPEIAPLVDPGTLLFSILAGVELEVLARLFPRAGGIVRVMPNLAVALGKSPIAMAGHGLDEAGRAMADALAAPLGLGEWLPEDSFDLITALTGSGPAFVYRFIDALTSGAHALGMEEAQARRLAVAMAEGAAALAAQSPHAPGELARRVASPGGTTEAGLRVLDRGDALNSLTIETLRAASERSAEMVREARQAGV